MCAWVVIGLKPLDIVLCSECGVSFYEAVLCVVCCMLFVMYGRRLFSRVLAMTERSEMDLYEVPMFLLCFPTSTCVG